MDRAYLAGAAATPPAAPASPSIGYPTAGNPSSGTPPTEPGPYLFHMLMEELMAIISAAGITPAQGNLTQLLSALRSAGVFQTQATGDQTTKVATTAFVNPGHLIAGNGYQKLPSGIIIQWCSASIATLGSISFPIAFPVACQKVFVSWIDAGGYAYVSSFTPSATIIGHNFGAARTIYVFAIGS